MTKKLLTRLNADLREMEHELKTTLPEEIHRAASLGDLSENAEYESALERQRLLQSKVRTLKNRINEIARIDVERLSPDRSGYGSILELLDLDTDKEVTYQLVMPEDAEISKGRISLSSPIGRALMGKVEGDEVTIKIPSGTKNFEILKVTCYLNTDQDL
jgi:transcription elongation factor GreA